MVDWLFLILVEKEKLKGLNMDLLSKGLPDEKHFRPSTVNLEHHVYNLRTHFFVDLDMKFRILLKPSG